MNPSSNPAAGSAAAGSGAQSSGSSHGQNVVPGMTQPASDGSQSAHKKKKSHRAGKKRRNRRQSFAAPSEHLSEASGIASETLAETQEEHATPERSSSFYRLGQMNRSNTSFESEALLDHREQPTLPQRRQSIQQGALAHKGSQPYVTRPKSGLLASNSQQIRSKLANTQYISDEDEDEDVNDRTPLIAPHHGSPSNRPTSGYGAKLSSVRGGDRHHSRRPSSRASSNTSKHNIFNPRRESTGSLSYDINNPPSIPGSPVAEAQDKPDDVMISDDDPLHRSAAMSRSTRDLLISIDENGGHDGYHTHSSPPSPNGTPDPGMLRRRTTVPATDDVCFPHDIMSEMGTEDQPARPEHEHHRRAHRRRSRRWPDFTPLEDWSREEKEERTLEGIRMRKISEPLMVGGRLRPRRSVWHREDDDAPYRYTYFHENLESTIHSQTISELVQSGQTFEDLFLPEGPELSSDESESDGEDWKLSNPFNDHGPTRVGSSAFPSTLNGSGHARMESRNSSRNSESKVRSSEENTEAPTPARSQTPQPAAAQALPSQSATPKPREARKGPPPTWWLDVLSPTEQEMSVLSKAFGIHALSREDIMMEEQREKVELFKNYYFVNYRTFDQDPNSEDYLQPINVYLVVFRTGVLSFHFSMIPHPANVRRRIRQLNDYLICNADWISYAIIDDITDVYQPLISTIEEEVDDIDGSILGMHHHQENTDNEPKDPKGKHLEYEKQNKGSDNGDHTGGDKGGDMLRSVGECRKKVMSLYRLLSTKADVIKGFAKRCNEQWEVAPRSEIGLYLGDIQDHIVTMTSNLSHYENILSRAHSNYLAQINLRMNERAEQTADILGKLTVIGTIVLPMNIITGMWGMNVWVPGQSNEGNVLWFWLITLGLLIFGVSSYFIAKRVYGIV